MQYGLKTVFCLEESLTLGFNRCIGVQARRALRALRSLVKIQALVRGYLVRKQAAMTLHRLQTLMRLQVDSIAVKNASYRKSMEQEVIQTFAA